MKVNLQIFKRIKLIYILLIIFIGIAFYFNSTTLAEQHFTYLAQSFLHGKTYFLTMPGSWADTVLFDGQHYWPQGFFPAVILMPFVFVADKFGLFFYQGFISFFLGLIIIYLIYKIARHFKYSPEDSIYWAFAFVFASAFIGLYLMPWSWYYAQVVTVALLFWLIFEYLNKKRYWLLSLIAFMVLSTRVSAGLGVFLFLFLDILFLREKKLSLFKTLSALFMFGVLGFVVFILYNYVRFGNLFETGYANNILTPDLIEARNYGVYNIVHIPGNIYFSFLSAPLPILKSEASIILKFPYLRPNPWGMSILITSPWILYLFFLKYKDKLSKILITAILIVLLLVLSYFSIGFRQFGYRYFFDFAPFVLLLLMKNYQEQSRVISKGLKILFAFSAIFNFYLFLVFYYRL